MASGSQNNTSYQAQKWTNLRAFTIGETAKNVDGTGDVSWSKDEILGTSDSSKFLRGDKTWSNTLVGPLYINNSTDVGLDQNGSLIIGSKSGLNIGIDDNEIMARNNSAASTLYLNSEGGTVQSGGTYYSSASPGFNNTVSAGSWSYLRLHNGSNFWDIATNSSYDGGALEFRINGASTGYYFKTTDIPAGAANMNAAVVANTITFHRNGILIPNPGTINDGGFLRVKGTGESDTILELGTWDDYGTGETIQFNYYPTTSQITPTYSVTVPKTNGTISVTGPSISGESHAAALQSYFNSYYSSEPRNVIVGHYSSAYGNGSLCLGYFLSGYESNPYGGFFVCHYDTPWYIGISNGSYNQKQLVRWNDSPTFGTIYADGSLYVSRNNATGGGIILADDGDIVDLNDGYCSMRFTYGVSIRSGNRGGDTRALLTNDGRLLVYTPNSWGTLVTQIGRQDGSAYGDRAVIGATNGNLHLDAYNGYAIYLNHYCPSGNVYFGNAGYCMHNNGANYNGTAAYASSAGNTDTVDGYHHNHFLHAWDWWSYDNGAHCDNLHYGSTFCYTTHGAPTAGMLVAFDCSNSHGYTLQLQGSYGSNTLYMRNRQGDGGWWHSWKQVACYGENASFNSVTTTSGRIYNNASIFLAVQGDGNLVLYNADGSARWSSGTASSSLVKYNIKPLNNADVDKFMRINPVSFTYKPELKYEDNRTKYGVIAEELMQLYPNLVFIPPDYDPKKFDLSKGMEQPRIIVYYEQFIPLLIKMVQNQQREIEELKNQLIKNSNH